MVSYVWLLGPDTMNSLPFDTILEFGSSDPKPIGKG